MFQRLAAFSALFTLSALAATPSLDTLAPDHPRLLLSEASLARLKDSAATDPDLRRIAMQVVEQADAMLAAPPLKHVLKGPRLLAVSRDCLDRVYTLTMAWRWTGEDRYATAAIENIKTVCAFPDWNPSHFLDVAEMAHAVGIGYDWLFHRMTNEERATIRAGLIRHGLEPGIKAYAEGAWWVTSEYNWNQVCNAGLLIGALAIAESDPDYGARILPAALASLPKALETYEPEGVWNEGPAYWHYATRYTAAGLHALETALGSDFGLGDREGLRETAWFPLLTAGPTGLLLNFADSASNSRRKPMPVLFWLSNRYRMLPVAAMEHHLLDAHPADAQHLVWYVPRPKDPDELPPLDRLFRGDTPVAISRSAWNDPNALFIGVKGGFNQVNHGQLDLGNFELDALGERWARDLGSDEYNLEGYFDKKPNGKRWNYYRNISQSHNVPLLAGEGQDPAGRAILVDSQTGEEGARVLLDLSGAYSTAISVFRGVATIQKRRAVVIQDEFQLKAPAEITWGMTTDATIEIVTDHEARLLQHGKVLTARVLSPAAARFTQESAAQAPPQNPNTGTRRLLAKVPAGDTTIRLTVLLQPHWPESAPAPIPEVLPLEAWW